LVEAGSGYLKTYGVAGSAFLWMRVDDINGQLNIRRRTDRDPVNE
jgi:hypothetical protein